MSCPHGEWHPQDCPICEIESKLHTAQAENEKQQAQVAMVLHALFDADANGQRLALELECLLLDTKDLSVVSKWWDSGMAALDDWREAKDNTLYAVTHSQNEWLHHHDQKVRDEAYERAARKVVHCNNRHEAAESIRELKGT